MRNHVDVIKSLLAKADSTSFPHEADALRTKANALMAKHSVTEQQLKPPPAQQPFMRSPFIWPNPPVRVHEAFIQNVNSTMGAPGVHFIINLDPSKAPRINVDEFMRGFEEVSGFTVQWNVKGQ